MQEAAKSIFEVVYGGSDKRRGAARKDESTEVQRVVERNTGCSCARIDVDFVGRDGYGGFDVDADAES
jgi:hypothetical protein